VNLDLPNYADWIARFALTFHILAPKDESYGGLGRDRFNRRLDYFSNSMADRDRLEKVRQELEKLKKQREEAEKELEELKTVLEEEGK
jgi:hypothetical protein